MAEKTTESRMDELAADRKVQTQAHAIGLLNSLESILTGWVLQHDPEQIKKLTDPIYELLDKD